MTLNREINFESIRGSLSKMPTRYAESAERFISVLESNTDDNHLGHFAYIKPRALRTIVSETASLTDDELALVMYAIHDKGFSNHPHFHFKYLVKGLVAIAPATSVVPIDAADDKSRERAKQLYLVKVIVGMSNERGAMPLFKAAVEMVTGRYFTVSDSETYEARGNYMSLAVNRAIAEEDHEWFGRNMESLVPFWGIFQRAGNFSRGYAEEVLSGAAEHGTALIEGVL